jgi:hypothetical protein
MTDEGAEDVLKVVGLGYPGIDLDADVRLFGAGDRF